MKNISFFLTVIALLTISAIFFVHDFYWPRTSEIKILRTSCSGVQLSLDKIGGNCGLHVSLKDGREEVLFLDRRMVGYTRKKDGMLYLGYEALAEGRPLDGSSEIGREFEVLLAYERHRWLVRAAGVYSDEYQAMLEEFAAAAERGRQATSPAPSVIGKKLWAKSYLNQQAPDFIVEKWLTAEPDRAGKFMLIDFWATWCGPCRKAMSDLNEIHRMFGDRVIVIGISDENENAVRAFKDPKMDYFMAIDGQNRMKKKLEVRGIPHVILVDPTGIVRWEGCPLLPENPLTADVVCSIIGKYPTKQTKPNRVAGGN